MFRGFRLIPVFEKWEIRDFSKLFVNKDLYNKVERSVYPKLVIKKKNNIQIPYKYQWESMDFYRKNAK